MKERYRENISKERGRRREEEQEGEEASKQTLELRNQVWLQTAKMVKEKER